MIDQIMIINDAGLPLFDWQPSDKASDSNLVSGFLSALNMFASGERGEQIKKLTMDPTTFIFERERNLVFVILTKDPQFETVIYLILTKLKEVFLAKFGERAEKFNGDISVFGPFEAMLEQILRDYGYFDYMQAMASFTKDESLRGTMFVDKTSGKVLFIKAKEYMDREQLSFQSVLLLKTFERLITGIYNESPIILNVISDTLRSMIMKSTPTIALIAEIQHKGVKQFPPLDITEKKIQNFLKRQYVKPNFGIEEPFLIFDENGKILVKNDNQNHLKSEKSIVDCLTLINAAKRIITNAFKENLFTILLGTQANLYFLCPIGRLSGVLLISTENLPPIKQMYEKLLNLATLSVDEMKEFGIALKKVYKFQSLFA